LWVSPARARQTASRRYEGHNPGKTRLAAADAAAKMQWCRQGRSRHSGSLSGAKMQVGAAGLSGGG